MYASAVNEQDRAFVAQIKVWIEVRLAERERSFGSLVADLSGVDPIVVATALSELAEGGGPVAAVAATLLSEAERVAPTEEPTRERPPPHPLDFYWAYTNESIDVIVAELLSCTETNDIISHLGTPNIFNIANQTLCDREHVLFDRSTPRTAAMSGGSGKVVCLDLLRDELPRLDAHAAVLDPPWYPDHMRGFLWAAGSLICVGANVWVSFPPPGTRATAAEEARQVLKWAVQGGFELLDRRPGAIRYSSSPFELSSHRAAGLGGIPLDWRSGELVRLRLRRPLSHPRPPAPPDEADWLPFLIDEIPIRVRDRQPGRSSIGSELLRSVVPGDVLLTVSRRDPRRAQVDIWTSLNRVWGSSHPPVLRAICRALNDGVEPATAVEASLGHKLRPVEREHVRRVAQNLHEVVQQEREEHGFDHIQREPRRNPSAA